MMMLMLVLVERWKCEEEEEEGGAEEERTAPPLVSAVRRVRGGARPGWMNQWQIPGTTSSCRPVSPILLDNIHITFFSSF